MGAEREVSSRQIPVSRKRYAICWVIGLVALALWGCRGVQTQNIMRIGLLAPFEGRYREVGYNAYYAVKLALQDYGQTDVELVAVDDGGTVESAVDRARALAGDPMTIAVIALGYAATDAETQAAFGDLPVLIVGHWGAKPETSSVLMMANPELDSLITALSQSNIIDAITLEAPIIGGDAFALEQFPMLRENLEGITIATSGSLPDSTFQQRYRNSAQFTPQPGLLATSTYTAAQMILTTWEQNKTLDRSGLQALLNANGFKDGYLESAPINYYAYDSERTLIPVNRPVE
jgi:ABC-type branched-subunit amino acid transport system substrate-binding protein